MKLNDYESQKIEWLLRYIYHQDLKWHRAQQQGRDGFLSMLIELIDIGDYFLVDGLIDAAWEAIFDVCSNFAVKLESRHLDEPTRGDGTVPAFDRFLDGIMKAITLTSATTGPTRLFRKFLVKFIVDVFACTPGVSVWSRKEIPMLRRKVRLAAKLRNLAMHIPGLEDELNAAWYQSAFPKLREEDSDSSSDVYFQDFAPEDTCSACSCHLDDGEANERLVITNSYGSVRENYCRRCAKKNIRCAKDTFTSDWRDFMMDDGSREELLPEAPGSTDQDLPDATA